MLPVVAIVGRPNVGKSSLFNRLIGKRRAIESMISGTTRDNVSEKIRFFDYDVLLVDTGGLELDATGDIEEDVQSQARTAIQGADLIVFVVDVREDLTAADFHAADLLRKSGKSTIMVANKCDHVSALEEKAYNFYELGFGDPVAVSAIHGTGLDELKDLAEGELKKLGFVPTPKVEPAHGLRMSFVGRPNVGKSSIINGLFGKKRVIVSDIPGTTRDAVEVPFEYNDHEYALIDTAGVRRRGKVQKGIEKFSVMRSLQAIEDSDVVVLVIDGNDGVRAQDLHVCEFVLAQAKGLIVTVNKMDCFEDQEKARRRLEGLLRKRMAFLPWAPVVFTSAKERRNLLPLLDLAWTIHERRQIEISQQELDYWLDDALNKHVPSGGKKGRQAKVTAVKQVGVNPPTFAFKVQFPSKLHFSYMRYLENRLREQFGFEGTALKMNFSKSKKNRPRSSR